MEQKSLLLPHTCQKAGWWMLAAFATLLGLSFVIKQNIINATNSITTILAFVVICLPTVGLIFVCLSKEKNEDEFINYLRMRTLKWIVVYAFISCAIKATVTYTAPYLFSLQTAGTIAQTCSFFVTNPMVLGLVYIIIFKASVLYYNLKSKSDGQ